MLEAAQLRKNDSVEPRVLALGKRLRPELSASASNIGAEGREMGSVREGLTGLAIDRELKRDSPGGYLANRCTSQDLADGLEQRAELADVEATDLLSSV